MKKINALKTIRIKGITPKSTNNLYYHPEPRKYILDGYYQEWRELMLATLPDIFLPSNMSNYGLYIEVGIMEEFDLDNTFKSIIDALQIKYGFNDNQLKFLKGKKVVTGKYPSHKNIDDYIQITLLEPIEVDFENVENIEIKEYNPQDFEVFSRSDYHPKLVEKLG